MKYIRTKDNIYEREKVIRIVADGKETCVWHADRDAEAIIKFANTIEDLCDVLIVKNKNENFPIVTSIEEMFKEDPPVVATNLKDYLVWFSTQFDYRVEYVVLAIWIDVEKGNPTLKPVARVREKGKIELL